MKGMVEELKRPATLIAAIIALASLFFSIIQSTYFYRISIPQARIFYSVRQYKVIDFDQLKSDGDRPSAPITIRDKNNERIEDNVYVANVKLWNEGNVELKKEDVRDPYRIVLNLNANNVQLFSQYHNNTVSNRIFIDHSGFITWDHFDPKTTFTINITYVSLQQAKVELKGTAIGPSEPQLIAVSDYGNSVSDRKYIGVSPLNRAFIVFTLTFLLLFVTGSHIMGHYILNRSLGIHKPIISAFRAFDAWQAIIVIGSLIIIFLSINAIDFGFLRFITDF